MIRCALLFIALTIVGCADAAPVSGSKAAANEPIVRVRIGRSVAELDIRGPREVKLWTGEGDSTTIRVAAPLTIRRSDGQWSINSRAATSFAGGPLHIDPVGDALIVVNDRPYPGAMRLVVEGNAALADQFHVINAVPIEAYLPGVLERELKAGWSLAAYHAQAIAARSYAIAHHTQHASMREWDVEATQRSQAYRGQATRRVAIQAAQDTAGLVLTVHDRIIPAMYSSSCGGVSLTASDAFGGPDVPGHLGLHHGDCCAASSDWRWGPIRRDRATLSKRIAAWGNYQGSQAAAKLGPINAITIVDRNAHKRPTRFGVADRSGHEIFFPADQFRIACNFRGSRSGAPALAGRNRLLSSYVDVAVSNDQVIFSDGRGRGHGVGMCQYGAQHMGRAGQHAIAILNEYYPTARVQRAY
ncbi:MAG: hypothetical protein CMJ49_04925 [Planctomycetaceae bacterium]|nr:hypothetical protein [Planctomycetaceae bacterium]